ncbi:hypothetical protein KUTeg_010192 [Tegillarca granosa]|uniref:Signal peptide peptidase-like 3 n=1 Tax=Tegillarca granosa TaxID=220873 RepID=A0ABQ9F612_TEGGR|nr:hypothetical protein KUTeg_010192 [Tegillarca granosa]
MPGVPAEEQLAEAATVSAFTVMDSSRLSTFVISILLIVYGSFRSLNLEQENRDKEKEKEKLTGAPATENEGNMQTIDTCQAAFLPIGASVSLLIMFLFFDSLQMVFAICTAVLATVAFAFLLLPMCQYMIRPCSSGQKISFGVCGRFTAAEILSFCLSFFIVCIWVLTGHWLLMDALGMGLCVAFIALVRLPSLKVSTLLLCGLLIYDVFWVFFSSYIFSANVMVKVATRPAENPVGLFAKKLHLTGLMRDAPKLSLPGKLVFPSMQNSSHFSMLGLGDIVMPGLLLCFVLRYDAYKKSQVTMLDVGVPPPPTYVQKVTYFHCSLIGYFLDFDLMTFDPVYNYMYEEVLYFILVGLLTATVSSEGDLRRMWNEPFIVQSTPKNLDV